MAKASQTTRILCEAVNAELLFDVEWFKDGVQVGGCEAVQRNTTCRIHGDKAKYKLIWKGSGTELTIWNVHHPFDSGNFTCVVKNIGGMDAKTALLDVHGKCADGKQMPTNCELIDKIIRKLKALMTTRTSQVCIFNYLTKVTILLHALLQIFHSLHFAAAHVLSTTGNDLFPSRVDVFNPGLSNQFSSSCSQTTRNIRKMIAEFETWS